MGMEPQLLQHGEFLRETSVYADDVVATFQIQGY